MPCFKPLHGFRSRFLSDKGLRPFVFNVAHGFADRPMVIPCGQCIGCRLERSRVWALRCVHEAKLYDDNAFITLTYDDSHIPDLGTLVKSDFQKFMKRLRQDAVRRGDQRKVRLFYCGEYGDRTGRPHYHACLFNFSFPDRVFLKETPAGEEIFESASLSALWPAGFATVGDVNFKSAAYTARYITGKATGPDSYDYYTVLDESGVRRKITPPYNNSSRRSGIGRGWYDLFKKDAYPSDFVILDGIKMRPPRAYDCYFEIDDPKLFRSIKRKRVLNAKRHSDNNTPERLAVREEVQRLKLLRLKRSVE